MKSLQHIILMLMLSIFFTTCSNKKEVDESYEKKTEAVERDNAYLFENTREPFYTVDPKLEDIESEIAMLKEKVLQYESEISTPKNNLEILCFTVCSRNSKHFLCKFLISSVETQCL